MAPHADPARAAPMQAYMKSALPFYGIPAPLRRRLTVAAAEAHPAADLPALLGAMRTLWSTARYREERRTGRTAVDAARPPERRMDRSQLEVQLKQTRERTFGPTRQGALLAMLFTYRDLTEPDLERYARFMESDAGSWYMRTLNRALVHSVGVIASLTGTEIVRALPPERWQGQRAAGAAR